MSEKEIILRLVLSCILGGAIGFERERNARPAGFRTNILVSLGSTLAMIVSIRLFLEFNHIQPVDPGRIAAQVISGVGFLGAGTIIREGFSVKGLTTSAGLWAVAGIGLSLGAGFYLSALVATLLVILTLTLLSKVEKTISNVHRKYLIRVKAFDQPGPLGKVGSVLGDNDIIIRDISIEHCYNEPNIYINFRVKKPKHIEVNYLFVLLTEISGIIEVQIKELD
ncbi:putative Mg2+ transporter-C (MgtC) family protein [Orenia metallireducens]|uniref:Putative Mg2+ transporter-C (MgtC) family protein n=1 Tax=Orenia metallireducens TaxID=1413210 RepID=A0A285FM84_9FIRM|nr:MgtC/SapB family protein [Orenia metallireducens]PRX33629.1 putative Mg2+ transporter-C (MgtC) family protein [Orenia metallireducens]SNY12389.1 putative Mg2+ transporter-C (MgtC) family protein [Orenia metallireducens]